MVIFADLWNKTRNPCQKKVEFREEGLYPFISHISLYLCLSVYLSPFLSLCQYLFNSFLSLSLLLFLIFCVSLSVPCFFVSFFLRFLLSISLIVSTSISFSFMWISLFLYLSFPLFLSISIFPSLFLTRSLFFPSKTKIRNRAVRRSPAEKKSSIVTVWCALASEEAVSSDGEDPDVQSQTSSGLPVVSLVSSILGNAWFRMKDKRFATLSREKSRDVFLR